MSTSEPNTCVDIADLDLEIRSPSNQVLNECPYVNQDDENNLVVLQFNPQNYGTGTYTVKVWINDSTSQRTYFGLAWWADRD